MNAPPLHPRLDVGLALREGWQAFQRAPWPFVGFSLLLTALQLALQALQPPFSVDKLPAPLNPETAATDWLALLPWLRYGIVSFCLLVFNVLAGVVLNLWGTCGMVRGAWLALGGTRPSFSSFTDWDPRALLRLYLPGFLLGCGLLAAMVMAILLAVVLSQANILFALLPGLLLLAGVLYLSVSQFFLPQVALLHDDHPFAALARGHQVVDPAWPQVVLLAMLNVGLLVAGLLACGVGLFVAMPVMVCVATAAYKQLFGSEDRTGLTHRLPEGST
ncbi:MAG: hypothetical protein VKN56_11830 [Cyanobacteriota bacterium]|nr:hypothetical protein [Cyanobacteriota bacterium]